MKSKSNLELEAHFLDIDVKKTHQIIKKLGAKDWGEDFLKEIIFYDKDLTWSAQRRFIRLRQTNKGTKLSYKHKETTGAIETTELEISVDDWEKTILLLERIGLVAFRIQEKKRHTYSYKNVTLDIDTWPGIPTYLEIEGNTEQEIKEVSEELGFDWNKAIFNGAGYIIEHYYHIPVTQLRHFTFDKIE